MKPNPSNKNIYWLLDEHRQPIGQHYRSRAPKGAALKAAARGHEDIWLFCGQSIWRFHGKRFAQNEFKGIYNPPAWADAPIWKSAVEPVDEFALSQAESEALRQRCEALGRTQS